LRILAFVLTLLTLAAAPLADAVTLTGVVSDAACGANHHGRSAAECTRACAEESGDYVLVVGARVYTLVGEDEVKAALREWAGDTVIVTGDRQRGDVVVVTAVRRRVE
jgi:hypothetical protein